MIINNKRENLKLTLGALMEIEEGLKISGLSDLSVRMSNPTAGEIALILSALLRGGGAKYTIDQVKAADFTISSAIEEVAKTFSEAFGKEGDSVLGKRDRNNDCDGAPG